MGFNISTAVKVAKSNAELISASNLKKLVGKKVTVLKIINKKRVILYEGRLRNYGKTFHPLVVSGVSLECEEWVAYAKLFLREWKKAESGKLIWGAIYIG